MAKLSKSEVFRISHLQANIIGRQHFPIILSKVSKMNSRYIGKYSSGYHIGLVEGTIDSTDLLCKILNIGLTLEETSGGHAIIPELGHQFYNYSSGAVYMSYKSNGWLINKIKSRQLILDNKAVELTTLASELAVLKEGYSILADGSVETSSGFTISKYGKFTDIYFWNDFLRKQLNDHIESTKVIAYKDKSITEKELQTDMITLWSLLKISAPADIDIDYEIGVKSGLKTIDHTESRYDLVVRVKNAVDLIELKKGVIDMSVVNYKVKVMEMGTKSPNIHPGFPIQHVLFIGSAVDPSVSTYLTNLGSTTKAITYLEYLKRISALVDRFNFNELELDMINSLIDRIKFKFNEDEKSS